MGDRSHRVPFRSRRRRHTGGVPGVGVREGGWRWAFLDGWMGLVKALRAVGGDFLSWI